MKILKLEIYKFRGITELILDLEGENLVIYGINGSGKSAVVDAIDFLLTGRVTRLTGEGTSGITLAKHGPHIDAVSTPEQSVVKGTILVNGIADPVEIYRTVKDHNKLQDNLTDKDDIRKLQDTLQKARDRQYVLTRREILRFVTADGSSRAEQIQGLMNISDIELIRKKFLTAKSTLEKEGFAIKKSIDQHKRTIAITCDLKELTKESLLEFINNQRAILKGSPIDRISPELFKKDIEPPSNNGSKINIDLLDSLISQLRDSISEDASEKILKEDTTLREQLKTLNDNPDQLRHLLQYDLLTQGNVLLEDSDNCPLCDTVWPPGTLKKHIESKIESALKAREIQAGINPVVKKITQDLTNIQTIVSQIANDMALEPSIDVKILQEVDEKVKKILACLEYPIKRYESETTAEQLKEILNNNILEKLDTHLNTLKQKYPKMSASQTAWDLLTRLTAQIEMLQSDHNYEKELNHATNRSKLLLDTFTDTKDEVLEGLYSSISETFSNLYRELHKDDENNFSAELNPKGPALEFLVDFHERGKHPPQALHSEGHQDSMGLCLYLCLNERLQKGLIDTIVLDDVVMSVDTSHRRELCKLLKKYYPTKQFIITTHDTTWANQLKTEQVVKRKGLKHFFDWNVASGPKLNEDSDIWTKIQASLDKDDVPEAAHRLRRGAEDFFSEVCGNISAKVRYKPEGNNELGDLLEGVIERMNSIFSKASKAANSWGDKDTMTEIQENKNTFNDLIKKTQADMWSVNSNVHYNEWVNFNKKDFEPVVEAFRELFNVFICLSCGSFLRIMLDGVNETGLKCKCSKSDINLEEKPKT